MENQNNNNDEEKKVEIEFPAMITREEILEILKSNAIEDVATAIHTHIQKETSRWFSEYERANNAEKRQREVDSILANAYLKQLKG